MPENVWFLLAEAVGATVVFTQGSIFKRLRDHGPALWQEFAHCPLCVGVWVGALLRWLQLRDILAANALVGGETALSGAGWAVALVGFGSTTGMFALLVKRVYDYLESASVRDDFEVGQGDKLAAVAAQMAGSMEGLTQSSQESSKAHAANMAALDERAREHHAEMERLRVGLGALHVVKKKSD